MLFEAAGNNPPTADPPFLWKAVFHAHTDASPDCSMTADTILKRCLDEGVDVYTVTDHGTIDGARRLKGRAHVQVIIGEEIRTREGGDIIGLCLHESIAPLLPAQDVLRAIRGQGGLVYFPHPFDTTRRSRWPAEIRDHILQEADIIEVFNARNIFASADRQAAAFAQTHGKIVCAGADAHLPSEIGRTVVYLPPFNSAAELLTSLRAAELRCVRNPRWRFLARRLLARVLP